MPHFLISVPLPNSVSPTDEYFANNLKTNTTFSLEACNSINNSKIEAIYTHLRAELLSTEMCVDIRRWDLPTFKSRTLDSLLNLSDDLSQLDIHFESIIKRQSSHFFQLSSCGNINDGENDNEPSISLAELASHHLASPFSYKPPEDPASIIDCTEKFLETFKWNSIKYRQDTPLSDLVVLFSSEMRQLEAAVKTSVSNFQATGNKLLALKKKQHGSLAVKPLSGIVRPHDPEFAESEFMQRVLLVVPISEEEAFLSSYERYASLVVPRSAELLSKDAEYCLYSVYVFNKYMLDFKTKAKESKIIIRDEPSPNESNDAEKKLEEELSKKLYMDWSEALSLIQTSFTEAYSIYLHLKAVRLFVESVLKFGLPPVYGVYLIHISPNAPKKHICEKFWHKHVTLPLSQIIHFGDKPQSNFSHTKPEDESASDPMDFESLPYILYRVTANFSPVKTNK